MALIDITIENPSLISTGEDDRTDTDADGPLSDDGSQPADADDGDLDDTMKNVSTLLTAATTVAGVVKQLRDEEGEEATSESEVAGLFDAEEEDADTDVGEDEAESFVESVVDEEELEEEDAPDEAEGTEDVEGDDSSGLGLKVALVLLVILVVLALWSRGGDEEAADEDY